MHTAPLYQRLALALSLAVQLSAPAYADEAADYFRAGVEKSQAGDYAAAVLEFDRVIVLLPAQPRDAGEAANLATAYYNRGTLKARLEDYPGALADFDKAITLRPDHAYSYDNRGAAKAFLDDPEGAIADWEQAIALDPDLKADIQPDIDSLRAITQ
jgi:tetratricopeptide (TPR) repeat protein